MDGVRSMAIFDFNQDHRLLGVYKVLRTFQNVKLVPLDVDFDKAYGAICKFVQHHSFNRHLRDDQAISKVADTGQTLGGRSGNDGRTQRQCSRCIRHQRLMNSDIVAQSCAKDVGKARMRLESMNVMGELRKRQGVTTDVGADIDGLTRPINQSRQDRHFDFIMVVAHLAQSESQSGHIITYTCTDVVMKRTEHTTALHDSLA